MNRIALLMALVLAGLSSPLAQEDLARRELNWYEGKRYELVVTLSDVEGAPLWEESEPNPPLSVRGAVTSAREVVKKIPNSQEWKWDSVTLLKAGNREGQWIYLVEFLPIRKDTVYVGPGRFRIPVLLNGRTPELVEK